MATTRFVSLTLLVCAVCVRHEQCTGNYCFVVHSSTPTPFAFALTLCECGKGAKRGRERRAKGDERRLRDSRTFVLFAESNCKSCFNFPKERDRGRQTEGESVRL